MLFPAVTEVLARLGRHPAVDEIVESLRHGSPEEALAGLTPPAKALVVALVAAELRRPVVVVVETGRAAEEMLEPLSFFYRTFGGMTSGGGSTAEAVSLLPALDALPGQGAGPHPDILETRAATLTHFVSGQTSVLIAPVAATLLGFAEPEFYEGLSRSLVRDQETSLEDVLAHLTRAGYVRTELVEMPGQFAVRGGILDVFPAEAVRPVRIELLGDTVESLREFDPETQRSTGPVNRVNLPPLTEFPSTYSTLAEDGARVPGDGRGRDAESASLPHGAHSLFELRDETVVVLDEPEALELAITALRKRLDEDGGGGEVEGGQATVVQHEDQWKTALHRTQRLSLEQLALRRGEREPRTLQVQPTTRYHGQVQAFFAEARNRLAAGEEVLVSAASAGELERFADLCREYAVPYRLGELEQSATGTRLVEDSAMGTAPGIVLLRTPLSEGFVIPDAKLAFYGTGDIFETLPVQERPRARPKTASFYSDFSELKPGDYVVHVDHGIGQFEGLQTIETDGRRGEFMRLLYADDARLYVPLERMDLVQSYRSLGDAKPQLDRLGSTAWGARKSRVKKSLTDLADKLLELYAERKAAPGFAFAPDTPWQHEFEDAFEFSETPDQLTAIADIKRDMERPTPMDRLLCGDVGYGKTEVAMRAAFKAISNSKQVAVLAPTTVLVFQHYETFRRRMAAFPVRIEMLSRFRSVEEQKMMLADLEAGKVDIVIGTHRLLSKDVHFTIWDCSSWTRSSASA